MDRAPRRTTTWGIAAALLATALTIQAQAPSPDGSAGQSSSAPAAPSLRRSPPSVEPASSSPAAPGASEVRAYAERNVNENRAAIAKGNDAIQDLKDLKANVEGLKTQFWWVSLAVTIILGVAGFFGWKTIKDGTDAMIQRSVEDRIKVLLPERLKDFEERAQKELLRVAQILALHAHSAHDEVLATFGWDGKSTSLRGSPLAVRRAVIDALHKSPVDRGKNQRQAWIAIIELAGEDQSAETLRMLLRLARSYRKDAEGIECYQRFRKQNVDDPASGRLAASLLRRCGKLNEALDLARKYRDDKDWMSIANTAALERDFGHFGAAHDLLLPIVEQILRERRLAVAGARHVLNTYIANCIDRRLPAHAVTAALYLLQTRPSAVEVFTVVRLAGELPLGGERDALRSSVESELGRAGAAPGPWRSDEITVN